VKAVGQQQRGKLIRAPPNTKHHSRHARPRRQPPHNPTTPRPSNPTPLTHHIYLAGVRAWTQACQSTPGNGRLRSPLDPRSEPPHRQEGGSPAEAFEPVTQTRVRDPQLLRPGADPVYAACSWACPHRLDHPRSNITAGPSGARTPAASGASSIRQAPRVDPLDAIFSGFGAPNSTDNSAHRPKGQLPARALHEGDRTHQCAGVSSPWSRLC